MKNKLTWQLGKDEVLRLEVHGDWVTVRPLHNMAWRWTTSYGDQGVMENVEDAQELGVHSLRMSLEDLLASPDREEQDLAAERLEYLSNLDEEGWSERLVFSRGVSRKKGGR